jgi:processive 1,2-diacylglycerol beta-glucosyltransferase
VASEDHPAQRQNLDSLGPIIGAQFKDVRKLILTRKKLGHDAASKAIGREPNRSAPARLLAETDWDITCAVGRDEGLRRQLTRLAEGRARPATILGWTDQIPRLLMTHHAVVSKAGGATTQEAIAARCPMIVNQVVPGQEEGNSELLRRHGVGGLAETPEAIVLELRRAFAHHGRVWNQWRTSLSGLARPDAARDIAIHLHANTAPGQEPVPVPMQPGAVSSEPRFIASTA